MQSRILRDRFAGRFHWMAAILLLLSFVMPGAAGAAPADYKPAMVRGAYLDALPLANAALAAAARGSARWRELALDVAWLRIDTGRYAQAERLLAEIRENLESDSDPASAATEAFLRGLLHMEREQNAQAAEAFTQAIKARTALHGADHPAVAEILTNFGQLLAFDEKFEASEKMLKKALDIQLRHLGKEALPLSVTYTYLGSLEDSRGNAAAAGQWAERALEIQRAGPSPDHPRTATSLFILSRAKTALSDIDGAIADLKRSMEIDVANRGEDHPYLGIAGDELAALHRGKGDFQAEREARQLSYRVNLNHFGPDHAYTLSSQIELAASHNYLGAYPQAIELFRDLALRLPKAKGVASDDFLYVLKNLGEALTLSTDFAGAVPVIREHFELVTRRFGPDHAQTLESQAALAVAQIGTGAYSEAVVLLRDLVPRLERTQGAESDDAMEALNNLGRALSFSANFSEAETVFRQLLELIESHFGSDHERMATTLNNLGTILFNQGRYAAAEPVLKRAADLLEAKFGREHPMFGTALANLGKIYYEQGLLQRARPLMQRALDVLEAHYGANSLETANPLNNLALAELLGGWYEDSKENFERVIAIFEKKLGPDHPELTNPLNNLALALHRLGRATEAHAPLARAIAIAEAKLGDDHTRTADLRHSMAKLLSEQGALDEAQSYLNRVMETQLAGLGPDHPRIAETLFTSAEFELQRDNRAGALAYLRKTREIFQKRAALATASSASDATAELRRAERVFMLHLTVLGSADADSPADIAEAFELAQLTQLGAAATAVTRMAARSAAGTGVLAQRVRDRQDAADRYNRADLALTQALGQAQDQRNLEAEETWRKQRKKAAALLNVLDSELARAFPRYQELVGVRPMEMAMAQSLLGPDEVLMSFVTIDEGTALIAVRGKQAQLHLIDFGAAELSAAVNKVRRGLDPTRISDIDDLHKFDAVTAHALYMKLFAPAEALLKGARHIFVVPDGALTSLPVGVLLTEAPKLERFDFDAYWDLPWLANRFAISVLPSVSALRSLRMVASGPASRRAMLGVGDPLLADHPSLSKPAPVEMQVSLLTAMRGRGASVPGLFRNDGLADIEAVKSLPSLPDTKAELEALRAAVGGETSLLLMRDQATEAKLRARTDLADYGILVFATHGLVGGELNGLTEPALVMTPPEQATAGDDGLLTASEISTLSLNADWVVLSACNTASGGGDGEGLSGLAKAFFYAGSRALFVSHWPVASDAAVKLTSAMFRAQAASPEIGKAEAHRRAIAAVMRDADNPMYAHPLFWAPFVVVGDGGTYQPNQPDPEPSR